MQRKSTVQTQNSVSQMHFAVTPYEIEYSVPNDQIYCIYLQKGLQILGTTQYPIENHEKLKKLDLPIQKNVIPFRMFSDRNAEYQWSIYKRVSEMQEFLESKKINLKDILKKQPEKKPQTLKLQIEKKESLGKSDAKRSQIKSSEGRNTSVRGSEVRVSQTKNTDSKGSDPNNQQKTSDASQSKGATYKESITSEIGKFTFKFYLFKAHSSQQLSKAIEEKAKQKQENRTPLSQINLNSLQEIRETEAQKESDTGKTEKMIVETPVTPKEIEGEANYPEIQSTEIPQKVQQTDRPLEVEEVRMSFDEMVKDIEEEQLVQKQSNKEESGTPQNREEMPNSVDEQFQSSIPQAFTGETSPQVVAQQNIDQTESPEQKSSKSIKRTESSIIEGSEPLLTAKTGTDKKKIVFILLIIIGIYLASYFKLFDQLGGLGGSGTVPQGPTKKVKKERFANRKKAATSTTTN